MPNNYETSKESLLYIQSGVVDPRVVAQEAVAGTLYILLLLGGFRVLQKQDNGLTTNWAPLAFLSDVTGAAGLMNVRVTAVDTTLTPADTYLQVNSAAPVTVNFPPLAANIGKLFVVETVGTGLVTLNAPMAGQLTGFLNAKYQSLNLIAVTATEWSVW